MALGYLAELLDLTLCSLPGIVGELLGKVGPLMTVIVPSPLCPARAFL